LCDSGHKLWKTEWLFTYPMDIGGSERAVTNNNTSTILDLQNSHATTVVVTDYSFDEKRPGRLAGRGDMGVPRLAGSDNEVMTGARPGSPQEADEPGRTGFQPVKDSLPGCHC
jgi:hypothetical protein